MRRVNRDQISEVARLSTSKNFICKICKRKNFILITLIDFDGAPSPDLLLISPVVLQRGMFRTKLLKISFCKYIADTLASKALGIN